MKSPMTNADLPAKPLGDSCVHLSNVNPLCTGLTKREEFVRTAMLGYISAGCNGMPDSDVIADYAIETADKVLAKMEEQS